MQIQTNRLSACIEIQLTVENHRIPMKGLYLPKTLGYHFELQWQ